MKPFAQNKKVRHEYTIMDTFVAGMSITGSEVKAIRDGRISLKESYVKVKNNQAFLVQAHISRPDYLNAFMKFEEVRERRLLLNKAELRTLQKAVDKDGLTVMALKAFQPQGAKTIKLEIALCKGKRDYDKRETLKRKQQDMDAKRSMSEKY
jgi:SsrA-binding protein